MHTTMETIASTLRHAHHNTTASHLPSATDGGHTPEKRFWRRRRKKIFTGVSPPSITTLLGLVAGPRLQGLVGGRNILQGHRPALGAGGRLHGPPRSHGHSQSQAARLPGPGAARPAPGRAARSPAASVRPVVCPPVCPVRRSGPVKKKHVHTHSIPFSFCHAPRGEPSSSPRHEGAEQPVLRSGRQKETKRMRGLVLQTPFGNSRYTHR